MRFRINCGFVVLSDSLSCIEMDCYSREQSIFIVKTHYQNGGFHAVTVLHTILRHHNALNETTVRQLIGTFEENGSNTRQLVTHRENVSKM